MQFEDATNSAFVNSTLKKTMLSNMLNMLQLKKDDEISKSYKWETVLHHCAKRRINMNLRAFFIL